MRWCRKTNVSILCVCELILYEPRGCVSRLVCTVHRYATVEDTSPAAAPYLLVWELLCMNHERLLSTYMAQALSSFPSIMSFMVLILATPNAGSGWLS